MIHNDHLATPQKMTDASGVVVWSADYKPFGETTVNTSSTITNNLRFPGQYFDTETGLNYNYFRDYNPVIGRYIEADPVGINRGENHLFVYVANNPLKYQDDLGLAVWPNVYYQFPPTGGFPPKSPPWNGNFFGPLSGQDNVCSWPMGSLNSNVCYKKCCKKHDADYAKNFCNFSSWIGNLFLPFVNQVCQQINNEAAECILKNLGNNAKSECECK